MYWKYKTDSFFLYREEKLPILAVPYERLVASPRSILQMVCAHLGIPFHENVLKHNEVQHAELYENGLTVGNTDPKRPVHSDSVGQWSTLLSNKDIELIARISGDLPDKVSAFLSRNP